MYAIEKLQLHGLKWFIRRIVREFIKPTTSIGQYFKPLSPLFYSLISKPANFIWTRFKRINTIKDTLYFFYDFDIEPITYDFVWALCVANARRKKLGLDFLHVVFVPGTIHGLRTESTKYNQVIDYNARIWRIYSLLLPCIKLLTCRYGFTLCTTRNEAILIKERQAKFVYPREYNVTFPIPYDPNVANLDGQSLPCLQADQNAIKYISEWLQLHSESKKVIVITLRQYCYTPERNSNIQAWAKFANQIDSQKYFIVFVPDTDEINVHKI